MVSKVLDLGERLARAHKTADELGTKVAPLAAAEEAEAARAQVRNLAVWLAPGWLT